jgi:CRP-like cAMP-binding protein
MSSSSTRLRRAGALCTDATWLGRADCHHCAVRKDVLFGELEDLELNAILEPIDQYCHPPHSVLYHVDEESSHLFTIRAGLVKLVSHRADGTLRIVRLLGRGDVVGLEAMLGGRYEHTAVALARSDVCRIPAAALRRLDARSPALHRRLLETWRSHLTRADESITELSTGSVRDRVRNLLIFLQRATQDRTGALALLNREDLAAMIGVRVESVSRVIAEAKRNGILRPLGGERYQLDRQALRAWQGQTPSV